MVTHPDVQEKAQQEIDEVVGRGRLPAFADFKHLHYTQAIVKEVLRWRYDTYFFLLRSHLIFQSPAAPISVPHALIEDDWYEGYFLPKGSMVIPNVW